MDKKTLEDNLARVQTHLKAMAIENATLRDRLDRVVSQCDEWIASCCAGRDRFCESYGCSTLAELRALAATDPH